MNPTVIETIRGFRGAIAAGTIWLLVLWVAFHRHLDPHMSTSPLAKLIGRLADILGQAGGLIVLAILAVAAGSVSQQIFRAPAMWLGTAAARFVALFERGITHLLSRLLRRPVLRRFDSWEPPAVDLARRIVAQTMPSTTDATARAEYRRLDKTIRTALLDPTERDGLIQLLDEQANLRFGLVIPLFALSVAGAIELSRWFLAFLPVPLIVAFQAGEFRALCNTYLTSRCEVEQKQ